MFDLEDEDAAFAYAEERMRATVSRLAVSNGALEPAAKYWKRCGPTMSTAHSTAARINLYMTIAGVSAVTRSTAERRCGRRIERIFAQYTQFEARALAVRGEHLHLTLESLVQRRRFRDDASVRERNRRRRAVHLHGRFDEDDFESAYRELERRYYAGEGAAFAEAGATVTSGRSL